ncbi:MAG: GNAT family N-acetyltransferase [Actinomycetota bacterium]
MTSRIGADTLLRIMSPLSTLDEDLLRALAANCGGAYLVGAQAPGRPYRVEDDLMLSDLGLPIALPPNNATLLRAPHGAREFEGLEARAREFFSVSPGGGYEIWSIWPTTDLAPFGYSLFVTPCMIREPGGEPRACPPELEVAEIDGDAGIREVWSVIDEVFCEHLVPEPLWDARMLSDDYRVWVGRLDGRAVATATAYVSDGFVGIYGVATLAEVRGCGYGEAVTWAATRCRPSLPATLQASEMGKTVYERMGYRTMTTFDVWERADRSARADISVGADPAPERGLPAQRVDGP